MERCLCEVLVFSDGMRCVKAKQSRSIENRKLLLTTHIERHQGIVFRVGLYYLYHLKLALKLASFLAIALQQLQFRVIRVYKLTIFSFLI